MIKLNSFTNFDNSVFKPDGLVGLDQEALATDFMGILSGYTPDQQSNNSSLPKPSETDVKDSAILGSGTYDQFPGKSESRFETETPSQKLVGVDYLMEGETSEKTWFAEKDGIAREMKDWNNSPSTEKIPSIANVADLLAGEITDVEPYEQNDVEEVIIANEQSDEFLEFKTSQVKSFFEMNPGIAIEDSGDFHAGFPPEYIPEKRGQQRLEPLPQKLKIDSSPVIVNNFTSDFPKPNVRFMIDQENFLELPKSNLQPLVGKLPDLNSLLSIENGNSEIVEIIEVSKPREPKSEWVKELKPNIGKVIINQSVSPDVIDSDLRKSIPDISERPLTTIENEPLNSVEKLNKAENYAVPVETARLQKSSFEFSVQSSAELLSPFVPLGAEPSDIPDKVGEAHYFDAHIEPKGKITTETTDHFNTLKLQEFPLKQIESDGPKTATRPKGIDKIEPQLDKVEPQLKETFRADTAIDDGSQVSEKPAVFEPEKVNSGELFSSDQNATLLSDVTKPVVSDITDFRESLFEFLGKNNRTKNPIQVDEISKEVYESDWADLPSETLRTEPKVETNQIFDIKTESFEIIDFPGEQIQSVDERFQNNDSTKFVSEPINREFRPLVESGRADVERLESSPVIDSAKTDQSIKVVVDDMGNLSLPLFSANNSEIAVSSGLGKDVSQNIVNRKDFAEINSNQSELSAVSEKLVNEMLPNSIDLESGILASPDPSKFEVQPHVNSESDEFIEPTLRKIITHESGNPAIVGPDNEIDQTPIVSALSKHELLTKAVSSDLMFDSAILETSQPRKSDFVDSPVIGKRVSDLIPNSTQPEKSIFPNLEIEKSQAQPIVNKDDAEIEESKVSKIITDQAANRSIANRDNQLNEKPFVAALLKSELLGKTVSKYESVDSSFSETALSGKTELADQTTSFKLVTDGMLQHPPERDRSVFANLNSEESEVQAILNSDAAETTESTVPKINTGDAANSKILNRTDQIFQTPPTTALRTSELSTKTDSRNETVASLVSKPSLLNNFESDDNPNVAMPFDVGVMTSTVDRGDLVEDTSPTIPNRNSIEIPSTMSQKSAEISDQAVVKTNLNNDQDVSNQTAPEIVKSQIIEIPTVQTSNSLTRLYSKISRIFRDDSKSRLSLNPIGISSAVDYVVSTDSGATSELNPAGASTDPIPGVISRSNSFQAKDQTRFFHGNDGGDIRYGFKPAKELMGSQQSDRGAEPFSDTNASDTPNLISKTRPNGFDISINPLERPIPRPETASLATGEFSRLNFDRFLNLTSNSNQMPNISNISNIEKLLNQIEPQIIEMVELAEPNEEKQMVKLRLNPAELGEVEVRLERDSSGNISAQFRATNEATRNILTESLGTLRDSLQNSGIKVENLEVSFNPSSSNGNDNRDEQSRQSEQVENRSDYAFGNDAENENQGDSQDDSAQRLVNLQA